MPERLINLENGERWNVLEAGQGRPIVFLHNGGGTLWNWAHQIEFFANSDRAGADRTRSYRVIAVDLPGFGRSERSSTPLSLSRYAQGLTQLLKHLELDPHQLDSLESNRPVLVGNCIGASIALEVALQSPQQFSALAVFNVCGGLKMLPPDLAFYAGWRPRAQRLQRLQESLFGLFAHPVFQRLGTQRMYANGQPEFPVALERHVNAERRDPRLRGSMYRLVLGLESFNVFTEMRHKPEGFPPVLLGWGAQNRTLEPRWIDVIAQWLQPERLWMIPQAGHLPMYEQPAAFNQELEAFLNGVFLNEVNRPTGSGLEGRLCQE